MKKQFVVIAIVLFLGITFSSCFHDHYHDHDISITINDDDDIYRMKASFNEDQTGSVQRIINAHLHQHRAEYLIHDYVDTGVTLDDGTVFHIKGRPGKLKIYFDKTQNSEESCERLKEMCDEIKDELARGDHDEDH